MTSRYVLVVLLMLTACGSIDPAPNAPIPAVCEDQVYADPLVKELILKGAGSSFYALNHTEELKYAKIDAARRCMQLKGLAPPGGGVQRPTVRD